VRLETKAYLEQSVLTASVAVGDLRSSQRVLKKDVTEPPKQISDEVRHLCSAWSALLLLPTSLLHRCLQGHKQQPGPILEHLIPSRCICWPSPGRATHTCRPRLLAR
jgi:hypothetical protein